MALASRAPGAACRPRSCLCRHRAAAGAPTYGAPVVAYEPIASTQERGWELRRAVL